MTIGRRGWDGRGDEKKQEPPQEPPGGQYENPPDDTESVAYDTPQTPDQVIAMFVKRMVAAVETGKKKQFMFGWTQGATHPGRGALVISGMTRPQDYFSALLTLLRMLQQRCGMKPMGLVQILMQEIVKQGGIL